MSTRHIDEPPTNISTCDFYWKLANCDTMLRLEWTHIKPASFVLINSFLVCNNGCASICPFGLFLPFGGENSCSGSIKATFPPLSSSSAANGRRQFHVSGGLTCAIYSSSSLSWVILVWKKKMLKLVEKWLCFCQRNNNHCYSLFP